MFTALVSALPSALASSSGTYEHEELFGSKSRCVVFCRLLSLGCPTHAHSEPSPLHVQDTHRPGNAYLIWICYIYTPWVKWFNILAKDISDSTDSWAATASHATNQVFDGLQSSGMATGLVHSWPFNYDSFGFTEDCLYGTCLLHLICGKESSLWSQN